MNKRTCKIVDFAVLADHRVKLKEGEKTNKYLDRAREMKNLWNMYQVHLEKSRKNWYKD